MAGCLITLDTNVVFQAVLVLDQLNRGEGADSLSKVSDDICVSEHVYMYMHMYVYMYVCMYYVHEQVYVYVLYVVVLVCVWVCACMCTCKCIPMCFCNVHMHMSVYMCMHMHVYMFMYMHVHMHIHLRRYVVMNGHGLSLQMRRNQLRGNVIGYSPLWHGRHVYPSRPEQAMGMHSSMRHCKSEFQL